MTSNLNNNIFWWNHSFYLLWCNDLTISHHHIRFFTSCGWLQSPTIKPPGYATVLLWNHSLVELPPRLPLVASLESGPWKRLQEGKINIGMVHGNLAWLVPVPWCVKKLRRGQNHYHWHTWFYIHIYYKGIMILIGINITFTYYTDMSELWPLDPVACC